MISNNYSVGVGGGNHKKEKPICNICRQEESFKNLISPCDCKGTGGFVHFDCIKRWIETSGNDHCKACNVIYRKLKMRKKSGSFGKFYHKSEIGILYSHFALFYFTMFFISHWAQFHSQMAFIYGYRTSARVITAINSFYLSFHVITYTIYLATLYLSFIVWQKTNFEIFVQRESPSPSSSSSPTSSSTVRNTTWHRCVFV